MPDKNERFARLMAAVEEQGGELVPGLCKGTPITYAAGVNHVVHTQKSDETHACNMERRFIVPPLPGPEESAPGVTTACMDGDLMTFWPRFQDEVLA